MKPIDLSAVAEDLARAAKYYLEDAFKDRLHGIVREQFDKDLLARGMEDVQELAPSLAAVYTSRGADVGGEPGIVVEVGPRRYALTRVITPMFRTDVEEVRNRAPAVIGEIKRAVTSYVATLTRAVAVASVPTLYVNVKAYNVEWMLWGYAGTPMPKPRQRKK